MSLHFPSKKKQKKQRRSLYAHSAPTATHSLSHSTTTTTTASSSAAVVVEHSTGAGSKAIKRKKASLDTQCPTPSLPIPPPPPTTNTTTTAATTTTTTAVTTTATPLSVLFGATNASSSQAVRSQFKAQKVSEFLESKRASETVNLQGTQSLTFPLRGGKNGQWRSVAVDKAAECFQSQGVVVLNGSHSEPLLPADLLCELKVAAEGVKQRVCERLQELEIPFETDAMQVKSDSGSSFISRADKLQKALEARKREERGCFRFQEASSRCLGRIDISLLGSWGAQKPFNDPALIRHPGITKLVQSFLGEDCELSYVGLVLSFPGSSNQPFHEDGTPLFFREDAGDTSYAHSNVQCPPHAINVFIPLQDVTEAVGPTEFIPSSHILENRSLLNERLRLGSEAGSASSVVLSPQHDINSSAPPAADLFYRKRMEGAVGPLLSEGSALLYDYRVR